MWEHLGGAHSLRSWRSSRHRPHRYSVVTGPPSPPPPSCTHTSLRFRSWQDGASPAAASFPSFDFFTDNRNQSVFVDPDKWNQKRSLQWPRPRSSRTRERVSRSRTRWAAGSFSFHLHHSSTLSSTSTLFYKLSAHCLVYSGSHTHQVKSAALSPQFVEWGD